VTEETKYLDQLFQSRFAGFEAEPPDRVWENVHSSLHGKGGSSINPVNLAILAALVMISGLLGFSIMKDSPSGLQDNLIVDGPTAMLFESELPPASLAVPSEKQALKNSADVPHPGDDHRAAVAIAPAKANDDLPSRDNEHNTLHEYHAAAAYSPAFTEKLRLNSLKARRPFMVHSHSDGMDAAGIQVRDSRYHPRFAGVNDGERRYNRRASWQAGILFTPEVIFYPDDAIQNQRSYTLDLSLKWQKKEFFIESGAGISFSSDDGKYAIDYEKFLGTYEDVYEVTFDTTESGAIVPVYHTNVVGVYDSINKFRIEKTKNQYTYLQIPVYVGFHQQYNRLGWFIKGGPVFSLLLNSNIPDPELGNDRIVDLDQQMPSRVNTHWQMAFSAGVTYQLSDKVSVAIEPTFRYYLNSLYERKYITTRHPYSFGVRTGLLFNF
jgi:hypothetical protein